jgi:flagellar biogenesis protein FliO
MGGTTMEILVRLGVSLGLIVGGLLVLRRWGRRPGRRVRGGITVETRTGLAKGASVAVVSVAGQRFLVGVTEHSVSLVAELEPDVDLDAAPSPLSDLDDLDDPHGDDLVDRGLDLRADAAVGSALPVGPGDLTRWDDLDGTHTGPRNGLVTRLQRMTLRTATSADRVPVD